MPCKQNETKRASETGGGTQSKRSDQLVIIDIALTTDSAPPVPSLEYTTSLRNLNDDDVGGAMRKRAHRIPKPRWGFARSLATLPEVTRGTMHDLVFIPDLEEEVDVAVPVKSAVAIQ